MSAVIISHAQKIYPNGFLALDDVSLTIEQGDFFALLGANGAGKTTLISALAGLHKLSSGNLWVLGRDVHQEPERVRQTLGIVPQEIAFDPFFTVREALRFQSGYFGIRKNDDLIDELLMNLSLSDKADTNTRMLSGGMKRRLMIAQALVHRPEIIVLDEPTAGVDVDLRQTLWKFIRRLNQEGRTIILTTHYLEEAQQLCNRVAMLKRGKLITCDNTEHLLHHDNCLKAAITAQRLPLEWHNSLCEKSNNRHIVSLENENALAHLLSDMHIQGIALEKIEILHDDLEQVFLRLMKAEE